MAVFHHISRRDSPAERDVAAAITRAYARERELEVRLHVLEDHIRAARNFAVAAHVLEPASG